MHVTSQNIYRQIQAKFPMLSDHHLLEEIVEVGKLLHFEAGKKILDYGDYVKLVPLILEGSIKVTRADEIEDKELLLYFLNAGETCSMSFTCCMMDKKSAIKTETVEPSIVIGIPIKYVDLWMSKYTVWKNFIMRSYDHKMLELVKVIDTIAFHNLDARMEKFLHALYESTGNAILNYTHQQIADDLNVSREAVSRLLKKMESLGKVKLGRNQIELVRL